MEFISEGKERIDKFLVQKLPAYSRSKFAKFIEAGGVRVDGKSVRASFELKPGMKVEVDPIPETPPHDLSPFEIELDIRYEDEYLLVVNKPRGLAVHPASSLKEPTLVNALLARSHQLSKHAGSFRPGIVHRLDKETTGLLLIAKTDEVHAKLAAQIQTKAVERQYFALVKGCLKEKRFVIDAPLGRHPLLRTHFAVSTKGKPARTHVQLVKQYESEALVAARLETGRTHQIRVHLSSMGHPIRGDRLYASDGWSEGPLQLHAAYLAFEHPTSGSKIEIYCEPPTDFIHHEDLMSQWNKIFTSNEC